MPTAIETHGLATRRFFAGTRNEAAMHIEDALVLLRYLTSIGTPDLSQYSGIDDPEEWKPIIECAEDCLVFLED